MKPIKPFYFKKEMLGVYTDLQFQTHWKIEVEVEWALHYIKDPIIRQMRGRAR